MNIEAIGNLRYVTYEVLRYLYPTYELDRNKHNNLLEYILGIEHDALTTLMKCGEINISSFAKLINFLGVDDKDVKLTWRRCYVYI